MTPLAMLRRFPAFAILILIAAGLMVAPGLHAARGGHPEVARAFLLHAAVFAAIGTMVGVALANRRPRHAARYHLTTILLAYLLLPLMLAAPVAQITPGLGLGRAYFEMLSSLTTTGATLFQQPLLVPESLHLWRALIGWAGGFLVLVTTFSVLAPLNLGGFEIREREDLRLANRRGGTIEEASARGLRIAFALGPVYGVFTAILALMLIAAGDRPFVAVCHAMATLSTSGVSPVGGLEGAASGRLGEAAILLFLLAAVSHRSLTFTLRRGERPRINDPEVRLMLISVLGITTLLFLRSFAGAAEIARQDQIVAAARAVWGSLFTVLSFLTTTGFESRDWTAMRLWSDLPDPGTILLGVAVMGGGVATTAGGVKLLRLYALYRQGQRELDLLIHPSSVWPHGQGDFAITARGARIAFVFLMLFLTSIALAMIALTLVGLSFQQALALAIAGVTTTGPAIRVLGDGLAYADLSDGALAILGAAMLVGRIEPLVLIALCNPAWWR